MRRSMRVAVAENVGAFEAVGQHQGFIVEQLNRVAVGDNLPLVA